jgi:broad specificity phosphatase PhoE
MTEIIIARHGETEWNVAEVFRGQIDIALNETGVKQAELLAGYLATSPIEAIYSSPLQRALKTAEVVARPHRLRVNVEPDLIDFNFGKWQGLSHQEVKEQYGELYAKWIAHPERVRMPDGETLDDVRRRATRFIDKVIEKHTSTAVIAGHRVVNKVLICALLGLDNSHFWKIRQDTGAISIFTRQNEQFILIRHNDTSFLKSLAGAPLSDF